MQEAVHAFGPLHLLLLQLPPATAAKLPPDVSSAAAVGAAQVVGLGEGIWALVIVFMVLTTWIGEGAESWALRAALRAVSLCGCGQYHCCLAPQVAPRLIA